MKVDIKALKSMLAEGPMTFEFNKKDGSRRKMTATTNPEWVGESITQKSAKVLTVWDLEKKDYRNIHTDAIAAF